MIFKRKAVSKALAELIKTMLGLTRPDEVEGEVKPSIVFLIL